MFFANIIGRVLAALLLLALVLILANDHSKGAPLGALSPSLGQLDLD